MWQLQYRKKEYFGGLMEEKDFRNKIDKLRKELDKLIIDKKADFEEILELSKELDELIKQHEYLNSNNKNF